MSKKVYEYTIKYLESDNTDPTAIFVYVTYCKDSDHAISNLFLSRPNVGKVLQCYRSGKSA